MFHKLLLLNKYPLIGCKPETPQRSLHKQDHRKKDHQILSHLQYNPKLLSPPPSCLHPSHAFQILCFRISAGALLSLFRRLCNCLLFYRFGITGGGTGRSSGTGYLFLSWKALLLTHLVDFMIKHGFRNLQLGAALLYIYCTCYCFRDHSN